MYSIKLLSDNDHFIWKCWESYSVLCSFSCHLIKKNLKYVTSMKNIVLLVKRIFLLKNIKKKMTPPPQQGRILMQGGLGESHCRNGSKQTRLCWESINTQLRDEGKSYKRFVSWSMNTALSLSKPSFGSGFFALM
jgi:hypothetical protein